jgi:hypothetical protein
MIITKKHLSRRTFLRGAFGATIALPMLDAMAPALGAQSRTAATAPFRFGVVYLPSGIYPDTWHPDAAGSGFAFKPTMQPLEPFRSNLVTISGMQAPWGESVHVGASSAFLNGVGPLVDRSGTGDAFGKIQSKKTLDQYIADVVAGDTPLRSIEVGTEDMGTAVGACDGFPCTFFNTLAWRDDTTALPVGINPRVTFERMFGEAGGTDQRAARLREKQSLLDSVGLETSRLKSKLAAPDRAILDEYLSNIRDVEQQLERMEKRMGTITGDASAPVGLPEAFDDHMSVTYNLMHLAFQGDISRVFTFMIGHEPSDRSYSHLGIAETHHNVSHHANDAEKLTKYAKIATYQMVKLAESLEKLKASSDGNGTLFDHSLIYFGSGMSNGNLHDRATPPAVLVGGAHGKLQGDRHIKVNKEPTANLLLSIAQIYGAQIDKFGVSTGRLEL